MSTSGDPASATRRLVGLYSALQVVASLLDFITQIVLRRELAPGEFGAVNTVLALVAVSAAPLIALTLVSRHPVLPANEAAQWRDHFPTFMRLATLGWGGATIATLFTLLPFLLLPRFSLQIFAVLAAEAVLASILCATLCAATKRMGLFVSLVLIGAAVRLAVSAVGAHYQPLAQAGVGAFFLGAVIVALPTLQDYEFPSMGAEGWALARKLLLPFLATASVSIAIALFTQANRIAAQPNFGAPDPANFGFVDLNRFDDFQTAGFLARCVLGATLPLLLIFWHQRAGLTRTTHRSLRWFWIYLAALVAGVLALIFAAPLANSIFTGDPAAFLPSFGAAVFMLGLLQGFAIFSLASSRWLECFVIGASGVAYTFFLFYAGKQPQLMTAYMFGGAMICLMLVLLVGVVRYARSHP